MERTGWSRAYFTVAGLAVVLVPLATFAVVWSITVSRHILRDFEIRDEAVGVANLGTPGFIALGVICWAVVAALAQLRDRSIAVAVSVVAIVTYLAICMLGVYDAWAIIIFDIRGLK